MQISNERHTDTVLDAALRDVSATLSETLKRLIRMHVDEIEKHVVLMCSNTLAHNEKVINAANRFSMFPKSGLVRQQTVMVRLINRLELIQERFKDDASAAGLLKVVEINLPHVKEGEQKMAELIKSKGEV